ncbi:hypothetical protein COT82_00120 [Candidatus Campbellbacteria bacterium CG10_big_fil_rev_8_21_14_0_10_35_52]|uniref:Uncharacterized protein n=1 Tax=Candidatus Campbellbacteria bacterium CG10_big_fil_rev_8_21_14_0_10_35_52 TaxID=1974527 RepID=A0A2M6WWB3_9BACT|nr:MAG: hypothetical protein COT82_00120 [Candidatus Campbellbacteria bacterium CG10_big_fil_rev_8_21_14_0_10_35_52]
MSPSRVQRSYERSELEKAGRFSPRASERKSQRVGERKIFNSKNQKIRNRKCADFFIALDDRHQLCYDSDYVIESSWLGQNRTFPTK